MVKKAGKNLNILFNGDNQLMYYREGKFYPVADQQIITSKQHRNFLITCAYGDWSPFLTWDEAMLRCSRIEEDYVGASSRPNYFFRVVERL